MSKKENESKQPNETETESASAAGASPFYSGIYGSPRFDQRRTFDDPYLSTWQHTLPPLVGNHPVLVSDTACSNCRSFPQRADEYGDVDPVAIGACFLRARYLRRGTIHAGHSPEPASFMGQNAERGNSLA